MSARLALKKPNPIKPTQKLNILKGRCILILIKTILFNNFFSKNNFSNTKKDLFMVCLGIRQLLFMNIVIFLNECAINDDIIIMGYSVCVALCRPYLCKHNLWKIHIYCKTNNPPPKKKMGWVFLCVFIFWVFFFFFAQHKHRLQ